MQFDPEMELEHQMYVILRSWYQFLHVYTFILGIVWSMVDKNVPRKKSFPPIWE